MIKFFRRIKSQKKEVHVKRKTYHLVILGSMLILSLFLVACNGTIKQQPTVNENTSQENQVLLPAVEANSSTENETPTEVVEDPYPTPEEKTEADSQPSPEKQPEIDSHPAPEPTMQEDIASESYPEPKETAPKPTPRGHDLVATDPNTVNLASGQLQLVEMFAFW
jgi:cytoskeletal protein RodZ